MFDEFSLSPSQQRQTNVGHFLTFKKNSNNLQDKSGCFHLLTTGDEMDSTAAATVFRREF
jgi:hypothetical protein